MKRRAFFSRIFGAAAAVAVAPVVAKSLPDVAEVAEPLASDTFTGAPWPSIVGSDPFWYVKEFAPNGFTITTTSTDTNCAKFYVVCG